MRVKETKRQGRIAHHHTDATVPHIVALLGFSFHDAKISIILLFSKFLSYFLPSSIIFLSSFIPSLTPHFIKLSRFCGITFAYSNIICIFAIKYWPMVVNDPGTTWSLSAGWWYDISWKLIASAIYSENLETSEISMMKCFG